MYLVHMLNDSFFDIFSTGNITKCWDVIMVFAIAPRALKGLYMYVHETGVEK